jgi:hypothetical protein
MSDFGEVISKVTEIKMPGLEGVTDSVVVEKAIAFAVIIGAVAWAGSKIFTAVKPNEENPQ